MKKPNTSRNGGTDTDNYTYNSNFSASDNFMSINDDRNNNKTEQIKLRRNLLNSNFQINKGKDEASTPKMISEDSSINNKEPEEPTIPLISYIEAFNYFQSLFYANQPHMIQEKDTNCCSCSSSNLIRQKNFILNLSRIKYDKQNNIHFRILFTIYYFFIKRNCTPEGEHWQDIGFQSDTPSTDLITVGMFGPLQLLYGINYYSNFYRNLFSYLLQRKCDLFFAVNMINLSKFCLNILERGIVEFNANDNDNLNLILNEVYVGMGYDYSNSIQQYGNSNILTIEFIVKTIQSISERRTEISHFRINHQRI